MLKITQNINLNISEISLITFLPNERDVPNMVGEMTRMKLPEAQEH